MSKDVYVYEYHDGLYINLTNRCTNSCVFCIRNENEGVGGNKLWLKEEPTALKVIDELKKYPQYKTVVFCGFGEPMYRVDEMIEVCKYLKNKDIKVKVNTNGHANVIAGRDVLPDLVGLVDKFSISLNADNAKEYQKQCRCQYGEEGYKYMLDFAREAVKLNFEVVLSIVDYMPEEVIENCRKITEDIGATFRVRHYT